MIRTLLALMLALGMSVPNAQGVDCADVGGNLVSNCGFDIDLADWPFVDGDGAVHAPDDGDGSPGGMEINAGEFSAFLAQVSHTCTPLTGGIPYGFGNSFRLVSSAATVNCKANLHFYSADCAGYLGVSRIGADVEASDSEWRVFREENPMMAPAEAQAVTLQMNCTSLADFVVRFDDAVLFRTGRVFGSGFEADEQPPP